MSTAPFVEHTAGLLETVRTRRPRVHCLMNGVVPKFVADGLTVIGAVPSMTSSADEIEAFAGRADALLVNLGTLDAGRRNVIALALDVVRPKGTPWIVDPAHCDASPDRSRYAQSLVAQGAFVLRANAAEMAAIGEIDGPVVVETGATDKVRGGANAVSISNGHPWLAEVTGTGCVSGAIIAAFLAVEPDPFKASVAATLTVAIAAEIAAPLVRGPGSFEPAWLDALFNLTPADIVEHSRISYDRT
ncbi:hydroxyethylthiazole kinase [Mesorhizobium sp. SB112]|uniref:hydroxyethylthiazole kinase n=1 Tax=Mesorhizobium sp. SB112 TaxID=3151853 RepID=UPI003267EA15